MLVGNEPGKGPVYGMMTIAADGDDADRFTTVTSMSYPFADDEEVRSGSGLVYTGFQWRGSSQRGNRESFREVMMVERDWRSMSGRWFRGDYDEFEVNVTLTSWLVPSLIVV